MAFEVTVSEKVFESKEEKGLWMKARAVRDSKRREVVRWAAQFYGLTGWALAHAILLFCQLAILYERDPGQEVLESAATGLVRGYGDCDLKAGLFVALCLACGLEAEEEDIFRGDNFPHVRARVKIDGAWYTVDPTVLNSDVGLLPHGTPITNVAHDYRRRRNKR